VGRHDHLRPALARLGARTVADGLRVRPGHPVWLGGLDGVPVLALPGNPGAALVMFHLLGRALLGHSPGWVTTPLLADITAREDDDRVFRCALAPGGLVPLEDQRPASVRAMGWCDALAWIPAGRALSAGDAVRATILH
jgi:molybdopterin molybdotransferase